MALLAVLDPAPATRDAAPVGSVEAHDLHADALAGVAVEHVDGVSLELGATGDERVAEPLPPPTPPEPHTKTETTVGEATSTSEPTPTPTPSDEASASHSTAAHQPTPSALDCTGYAEPRVWLEVQDWWDGEPLRRFDGDPLSPGQRHHVHVGTCFPLGQTVSGKVTLDIRIMLHNNPGTLFRYETGIFPTNQPFVISLNETCATTECTYWVQQVVDTNVADEDGWYEWRFKARVRQSDGSIGLTSSGWPLYIENGKPDGGGRAEMGAIVARGWYTDSGYQNPVLQNADLAVGNVSGTITLQLRLDRGSGGDTTTFSGAYIDPAFHQNDPGLVIGEWDGAFRGEVQLDTTRLTNGPHRLVLVTEGENANGVNSGVQVITLHVAN